MKKSVSIFLVLIVILLTLFFFNKSDFHGNIAELNENEYTFTLFPLEIDPEAEYDSPEIQFDNNTKVVGNVTKIKDLRDGQEVKVWVTGSEKVKYANKIKVIK